jgi:SSS family solute:Na+ symporter
MRTGDLLVILIGLGVVVIIGLVTSRRNTSPEAYFMAGRRMPGWAVGFSLMATLISSSSFLALPEFSYRHDWRFVGTCLVFPIALACAWKWFMPLYRRCRVASAYEYFENRFGIWIRLYVALGFVLFAFLKMGIVLYGTSIAISAVSGFEAVPVILFFGIVVIAYTAIGGFEAVVWTDVIQGLALMLGGLACLPVIAANLPGGLSQVFTDGADARKFALAADQYHLIHFGLLVIVLGNLFDYLRMTTTDQMFIQRYSAPKSSRQARKTLALAGVTSVFVWTYFTFIGTALWVFYRHVPDERVMTLDPLKIFPHFIVTQLPVFIGGFVILGLIMAGLSTLDSSINSIAQTVSTDFYRRLVAPNRSNRHYLRAGQVISIVFGTFMILTALYIHQSRTTTLQELQNILTAIFGSGLAGIFLLGFATRRARYIPVLLAIALMLAGVLAWLILDRTALKDQMPHDLWLAVFTNVFVFVVGYCMSLFGGRPSNRDLTGLTVWTSGKQGDEEA